MLVCLKELCVDGFKVPFGIGLSKLGIGSGGGGLALQAMCLVQCRGVLASGLN